MVGQTVSARRFRLDAEALAAYVEAVDDRSMRWGEGTEQFVPPMVIVAMALQGAIASMGIPGGTVHIGQEFEIAGPVRLGQTVGCETVVVQNSVRGEIRFVAVSFNVTDDQGMLIMSAKSTLMLPAQA